MNMKEVDQASIDKVTKVKGIREAFSKEISHGELNLSNGLVEVIKMKGNFWRSYGFSKQGKNYLHAEEALYLFERGQLAIENNGQQLLGPMLYETLVANITMNCYLAYAKLKSLEYAVFRYGKSIKCFDTDENLAEACQPDADTQGSWLSKVISYKVYVRDPEWSKKVMDVRPPVSYVLILSGDFLPDGKITSKLLSECGEVPLLLVAISRTGHVMLQELTNAINTLDLLNLDFDHSANSDITVKDVATSLIELKKKRKSIAYAASKS